MNNELKRIANAILYFNRWTITTKNDAFKINETSLEFSSYAEFIKYYVNKTYLTHVCLVANIQLHNVYNTYAIESKEIFFLLKERNLFLIVEKDCLSVRDLTIHKIIDHDEEEYLLVVGAVTNLII